MDNQQFYETLATTGSFITNLNKLLVVLIRRNFCQVLKALSEGASTVHGFSSCFFFRELLFPSEESRVIDHFLVYHVPRTHDANLLPTYNRIIRKLSGAFLPNDHRSWVHQHYPFKMIFLL